MSQVLENSEENSRFDYLDESTKEQLLDNRKAGNTNIGVFPKYSRPFIEFSEFTGIS